MRKNYSLNGKSGDTEFCIEKYLCPFCPTASGSPGELTVAFEKTSSRIAWTECTKGYANCCSIAELHAKLTVIEPH